MKNIKIALVPIMLGFFAMGMVDMVGTASNYVQQDANISDSVAGLLPSLVFVWFLLLSVPTGILMNHIGRRKTVMLSLMVTVVALFTPLFGDSFAVMLTAFSLLGIGNALMQVSLNPLLATLVQGKSVSAALTFGQFVKAIASFSAPLLIPLCAQSQLQLGWRTIFLIYGVIALLTLLWLALTKIREEQPEQASGFKDCFALLGTPIVLLCFVGIICHVGIDVGTNTIAPKIFQERLGISLDDAAISNQIYFILRTIGCFAGAFILQRVAARGFFLVSVLLILSGVIVLCIGTTYTLLALGIGLVGIGNSNVFSVIFSQALLALPAKKNEISGLMITAVFGGALFPPLMGMASDGVGGQIGALAVMTIGIIYLIIYGLKIKN